MANPFETALSLLESDYFRGPGMDGRPDFNYTTSQRNFDPVDHDIEWPYDGTAGGGDPLGGPVNARGNTGQQGIGRGGVGMGGREDMSGGPQDPPEDERIAQPEDLGEAAETQPPVYTIEQVFNGEKFETASAEEAAAWILKNKIWLDNNMAKKKPSLQQMASIVKSVPLGSTQEIAAFDIKFALPRDYNFDEGADWEEMQRHGDDKYRNVWRDTPEGKRLTKMSDGDLEEAMGTPTNFAQAYGRGGNMWGGANTIPGSSQGWARSPIKPEDDQDPRKDPMHDLKEFFSPEPVQAEEIDNPGQDNLKDQSDEEIETDIDKNYGRESNDDFEQPPESPLAGLEDDQPQAFQLSMASPALQPPPGLPRPGELASAAAGHAELVDKASAWDVLQKVVDALGNGQLMDTKIP